MTYAVETRGLTRDFGATRAVDSLSLSVERGEIFGLVGPDGAGKTTTLRMLTAILDPTAGEAFVMGRNVAAEASSIHDVIGYMSQRFGLYPDLSVLENIAFYADLYGVPRKGLHDRIDELLSFSGMLPFKKRFARNLSGGMKQKLGLACALIHAPEVLFLDEPTNGVDPVSRRDFWRIIHHLVARQGVTIVVSTSYLDEAERCSRVAMLDHGRLVLCDTPAGIRERLAARVLEVRTPAVRRAAAVLRAELHDAFVETFGDRVAVLSSGDVEPEIRRCLAAADIAIDAIDEVEPSIENAFLAILGERKDRSA